jgi:hypothetical protein
MSRPGRSGPVRRLGKRGRLPDGPEGPALDKEQQTQRPAKATAPAATDLAAVANQLAGADRGGRYHLWRRRSVAGRLGDRNAREVSVALPKPPAGSELKGSGVYALARHPIYGGILLLSVAWSLALVPWALIPTSALAIALVFKSHLEERWLIDRHPAYVGYRERVRRRFVPYLW